METQDWVDQANKASLIGTPAKTALAVVGSGHRSYESLLTTELGSRVRVAVTAPSRQGWVGREGPRQEKH
jgi:hypothetical protein